MDVKKEFIRLKTQWMKAKGGDKEKADAEMEQFIASLTDDEKALLHQAVDEDLSNLHHSVDEARELAKCIEVRKQLEAVLPFISVSQFAKCYFGKSASWLHQRINGNAVHGKSAEFTQEELGTLVYALNDMAGKLTHVASSFA